MNDEVAASQCPTSLAELLLRGERLEEAERAEKEVLTYAQAGSDTQTQGNYQESDQLFGQALELLDTSNSHEVAASAYFRYATLLEERGEVQRSLTAIKQAYGHQRRETHGDLGEAR